VSDSTRDSDETPSSPPSARPADRDRRGWLYGAGIAVVVVVGLIAFAATRGGNGDGSGGMPGMDMGGMEMGDAGDLPEMQMSGVSRMGDLVMPPGMVMTSGMSMAAMRDMAAVDPGEMDADAPDDARGDQPLEPRVVEGVKEFELAASVVRWDILPGVEVLAYAFNEQVPGPRLQFTVGDRVRIRVTNDLPEATSVHWHGLDVPNGMDGPAEITQDPIEPGESFTYEFGVEQAGTFFYHSHAAADRQQALGLYGALLVAPREPEPPVAADVVVQLQEWTVRAGWTFPAMPMEGLLPNFFTINGKAWPATETIRVRVGDQVRVRFIGSGAFAHPMHIHGGPFEIVATDGNPVPPGARLTKDTVNVSPGERYDVLWTARQPGRWLLHCHINHHLTNDGAETGGAGGLSMVIDVAA
jgi:FtsP/CotA-like multicopper oxidase with cupredoxin domain